YQIVEKYKHLKGASAPFFFSINRSMKSPIKEILGLIILFWFMLVLSQILNYMNPKPTVDDLIKEKVEEAENSPLTDKEKELVTDAETKAWEEVDKDTVIIIPKKKPIN
ncbi:MAG: hypothetical protein VW955_02895, partial [Gammaproteobacteria bacterium]